jgi:hypothetical protein
VKLQQRSRWTTESLQGQSSPKITLLRVRDQTLLRRSTQDNARLHYGIFQFVFVRVLLSYISSAEDLDLFSKYGSTARSNARKDVPTVKSSTNVFFSSLDNLLDTLRSSSEPYSARSSCVCRPQRLTHCSELFCCLHDCIYPMRSLRCIPLQWNS